MANPKQDAIDMAIGSVKSSMLAIVGAVVVFCVIKGWEKVK